MKQQKALLVALIAVFMLGGCSGKSPTNAAGAATAPPLTTVPSTAVPSASSSASPSTASPAASVSPSATAVPNDKPVAPEKNPTGDISDSQAFIKYSSVKGGYSLVVPEGWARKEQAASADFIDKLDGVSIVIESSSQAPTVESIKTNQAAALSKTGRAVKIENIQAISSTNGKAVKVKFTSNSEADAVTSKQVRLDNESYYFYKNGKLATLTVWAPLGADNVDQWKKMSDSFRWDTP
jgi:PBP1b-binding outer membrane lipoprotein LpoB